MKRKKIWQYVKLTKRQLQALPHILAAGSYEEAARRAGISAKQIYEWLKDPYFKAELDQFRQQMMQTAVNVLAANTTKAAEALASLLESSSDSVRRGAANDILTQSLKLRETFEFTERLEKVEQAVEKHGHK